MKHYRKTIKSIRNDNGCGLSKYKKITEGGGKMCMSKIGLTIDR